MDIYMYCKNQNDFQWVSGVFLLPYFVCFLATLFSCYLILWPSATTIFKWDLFIIILYFWKNWSTNASGDRTQNFSYWRVFIHRYTSLKCFRMDSETIRMNWKRKRTSKRDIFKVAVWIIPTILIYLYSHLFH